MASRTIVEPESPILGVNRNVFFLGVVSFLTDVSSEMILTVLPLFLANVLGVKASIIGVIEGVADSTATLMRVPSGWLSDRIRRRKGLTTLGYSVSALSKPFLYLAGSWGAVLGLRFADRVGKGVRTAPRDALVADSSTPETMGRSFGLHRAMDTAGAVLGILGAALVVMLMQQGALDLHRSTFRTIVLVATVPGLLAVLVLWLFVHESKPAEAKPSSATAEGSHEGGFSLRFKLLLGVLLLFALGNSSDAFLILRAQNLGMSVVYVLLIMAAFNAVSAAFSMPAGILSDKIGRTRLILAGWVVYALVYLGFAVAGAAWQVAFLFLAYGFYYAAADGAGRALVADMVPAARRGTAYGLYNTAVGITAFPASLIAGWLWQAYTPRAPFFFGAALAAMAAVLLLVVLRPGKEAQANG